MTDIAATTIAINVRPPISTQAGTGVARRRFRIPSSRSTVIEMTRLTNDAAMTAIAEMPGHVEVEASAAHRRPCRCRRRRRR